jgi:uncharacterized phage-associated protein
MSDFHKQSSALGNAIQREKMYEALAYFSGHVKCAGQLKLFKLLYYLDLVHFRRTGKTVTGLSYEAWPRGPVPAALYEQFSDQNSDLHGRFEVEKFKKLEQYETPSVDSTEEQVEAGSYTSRYLPGSLRPKKAFKHLYLTRREMKIAEELATIFYEATAKDMTDVTHGKSGPWMKALHRARRTGEKTPLIDLLEGVTAVGKPADELPADELREILRERAQFEEAIK